MIQYKLVDDIPPYDLQLKVFLDNINIKESILTTHRLMQSIQAENTRLINSKKVTFKITNNSINKNKRYYDHTCLISAIEDFIAKKYIR